MTKQKNHKLPSSPPYINRNRTSSKAIFPFPVSGKHTHKHRIITGTALLANLATSTAFAQTATESPTLSLSDVVVTARSEADQITQQQLEQERSTPASVNLLTANQLEAAQINDLESAAPLLPSFSLTFGNSRNTSFNIRGFGAASSDATDGIWGGSPIYLNGVYQPFVGQSLFSIPGIAGILVRQGPNSTDGGQDSTGGAVYVTTTMPSFKAQKQFDFQYGSYNSIQVRASATGAIADSDKAAFRLSFISNDNRGWITSTTTGEKYNSAYNKAAQLQVLLTPSNDLTALLTASYNHSSRGCCITGFAGIINNYTDGTPIPANNYYYNRVARMGNQVQNPQQYIGTYTTNGWGWQNTTQDSYQASAKIDYNADKFTLTSISAFTQWDFHPHNGFQQNPGNEYIVGSGNQITGRSAQQEIKFSTLKGGPVEATGGLFFLYSQSYDWAKNAHGALQGLWVNNTSYTPAINARALNYLMRSNYDNPRTIEIAPYIQALWHATPDLDVTFGARYSYNYKDSISTQWISSAQPIDDLSAANQAKVLALRTSNMGPNRSFYADVHQGIVSLLATATYKFTPDVFAWVTASQGGRAGGPNVPLAGNVSDVVPRTVKQERIENYEVGLRGSWFDHRVSASVAAFTMFNHNYITQSVNVIEEQPYTYLSNAELSVSRGVEVTLRTQPIEGLSTYSTFLYDDAYYGSFTNAPCPFEVRVQSTGCNLTGKPLSNVSKFSFAIGGEYSYPVSHLFTSFTDQPVLAYAGADFNWRSWRYSDTSNSAYSIIEPVGLLNLHAGLRLADRSWDLSGWAHNALNNHYYTNLSPGTGGAIMAAVGAPLMVGFTLRARL